MKYVVVIMDGAAGWPLADRGGKTCLELAETPNLDAMARQAVLGMARTIPDGLEASSSNACMSVLGYDPARYLLGRAAIEATSLGIPVGPDETVFRCNLVTAGNGTMEDYSAGHISTDEAKRLISDVNDALGSETVTFYPGLAYRHILKIKGDREVLNAVCTPPHDISGQPLDGKLPRGEGSGLLLDLMARSREVLSDHPVNLARKARGEATADTVWLFWPSAGIPEMPSFKSTYGVRPAVSSAVDVINGLAMILGMDVLNLPGITDGMDNDFAGQAEGSLNALADHDMAVIHIEAPDEAGHGGSAEEKKGAIGIIDREVMGRIRAWRDDDMRVLVMPDHPTPVELKTHTSEAVPFMLWGAGFSGNGASRFTEAEALKSGLLIDPAYTIMKRLTGED